MRTNAFSKTYGNRTVLRVGPVELEPGRIHVLVGANGSGKSTFARILAGIETADNREKPFVGDVRTGYLPQKPYAFRMSLERNLRIASGEPEREEELIRLLKLEPVRRTAANRLSGGETARMALARSLMKPCDLLILDEPSASMDMESTILSEESILAYREKTGAAILLITHSLRQAGRMGENLLFFREGELRESGPCAECLTHPKTEDLRRFLDFYGA